MIKKMFLILSLIFLGACSSSEKDSEKSYDDMPTVDDTVPAESKPAPKSKAEKQTKKANGLNPQSQNLMDAIRSGSDEAVYKASTTLLTTQPQDTKALMALGMYHYRRGKPQLAMYFYSRVLSLKAVSSEVYNNIGLANLAMKEQKEAIRSFRKAIEINPQDLNAAGNLSALYLQVKDYGKAYVILEMAMKKGTQDVRLLTNYAIASAGRGKLEQAESLYLEIFKRHQNHKEGLYNYAVFQIEHQKKYKEGLETISKLKFLGPGENMKTHIIALENKANAGLK